MLKPILKKNLATISLSANVLLVTVVLIMGMVYFKNRPYRYSTIYVDGKQCTLRTDARTGQVLIARYQGWEPYKGAETVKDSDLVPMFVKPP